MSNLKSTMLNTGEVRLSYAHLTQPYAHQPGADPKYSVTLLIPKTDTATKQAIDAAMEAAIQDGIASKWGGTRPNQIATPIYDGDGLRPNGDAFGAECKGHWVMTASSFRAPELVDASLQPIVSPSEVYSGMYAQVNINFFSYHNSGRKGVGCGLGPVKKTRDGEPLGGGISASQAFGAPQPLQPPTQPAAPVQSQPIDPITGKPLVGPLMGM